MTNPPFTNWATPNGYQHLAVTAHTAVMQAQEFLRRRLASCQVNVVDVYHEGLLTKPAWCCQRTCWTLKVRAPPGWPHHIFNIRSGALFNVNCLHSWVGGIRSTLAALPSRR